MPRYSRACSRRCRPTERAGSHRGGPWPLGEYGAHTDYSKPKSDDLLEKWKSIGKEFNHLYHAGDQVAGDFAREMVSFHRNEYAANKLVVFAKNECSWHAVPKITCPDHLARRALVINLKRPLRSS